MVAITSLKSRVGGWGVGGMGGDGRRGGIPRISGPFNPPRAAAAEYNMRGGAGGSDCDDVTRNLT